MDAIEYDEAKATMGLLGGIRKLDPDGGGGLAIGRRTVVMVTPVRENREPAEGFSFHDQEHHGHSSSSRSKAGAVHVVDHGENQKEAIRRLFDAQVMIASLEGQLEEKEQLIIRLNKILQKVGIDGEKEAAKQLETAAGQSKQIVVQNIVQESSQGRDQGRQSRRLSPRRDSQRDSQRDSSTSRRESSVSRRESSRLGGGDGEGFVCKVCGGCERGENLESGREGASEAAPQIAREPSSADKQRIQAEKVAAQQKKIEDARSQPTTKAGEEKRSLPKWLQADEQSRQAIENCWSQMLRDFMDRGNNLEKQFAVETLWQCGYEFAMRWGGSPNEELERQIKSLTEKLNKVQRSAQGETAMLRQHIRKIEVQYNRLKDDAMQQQPGQRPMASPKAPDKQAVGSDGRRGAIVPNTPAGSGPASSPQGAPRSPTLPQSTTNASIGRASTPSGSQALSAGGRAAPTPTPKSTTSPKLGVALQASPTGAGGGRVRASPAASPTVAGMSSPQSFGLGTTSNTFAFGEMTEMSANQELAEDDTLIVTIRDPMELETMDHEIFEPIKVMDADQQELIIDMVNAKVRRILQLDPAKWTDGRLPFGLRPDDVPADVVKLEAENRHYMNEVRESRETIETLRQQLMAAQDLLNKPKDTSSPRKHNNAMMMWQAATAAVAEKPEPIKGRGRPPIQEQPPSEEDNGPCLPDPKMLQQQKIMGDRIKSLEAELKAEKDKLKEANDRAEDFRQKLAQREAQLKDLEKEIAKLRAQLQQAGLKVEKPPRPIAATGDRSYWVDIDRSDGGDAGLDVEIEGNLLRVDRVSPKGKIADWNASNPDAAVKEGDYIEEINGISGNGEKLLAAFKEQKLLKMKFSRAGQSHKKPKAATSNGASQALRKTQTMLHQVLSHVATEKHLEQSEPQQEVEGLLKLGALAGNNDMETRSLTSQGTQASSILETRPTTAEFDNGFRPNSKEHHSTRLKAVPHFENWIDELMPAGNQELEELREKCKSQQEEITRLVLIIDELRARLEKIPEEAPPEIAPQMGGLLEKVGLKDIVDVGLAAKNRPSPSDNDLRPVFLRLYQDAMQRLQRFAIIRETVKATSKAYMEIAETGSGPGLNPSLSSETGCGPGLAQVWPYKGNFPPELERLNATAQAALNSMWYHADHSFRRMCDYAVVQGVEALLTKSHKASLDELMATSMAAEDTDNPRDTPEVLEGRTGEAWRASRGGRETRERLPGRRSERPRGFPLAASHQMSCSDGFATQKVLSSALSPGAGGQPERSPRHQHIRKAQLMDPDPTAFATYVAAVKEARGDLQPEEWARASMNASMKKAFDRKALKTDDLGGRRLKAAVAVRAGTADSLQTSHSLPVLPKIRRATPESETGRGSL